MRKFTPRRATLLLAAMAMAALLAVVPAWADTTFTVDSTTDAPDADPGDGACSTAADECTLRAAIEQANALSGDDVVGFDPSVGGTITLGGSELLIASNLKIEGPGEDELSVSADNKSRVFNVRGATVEIGGLTITGGTGEVMGNRFGSSLCGGARLGGGIYNDRATLTLSDSTISGNGGCGGGMYNLFGTLTLSDSTVSENTSPSNCGGICNSDGTLTVEKSTISGNTSNYGGGILSGSYGGGNASSTITDSTISANTAKEGQGGGLFHTTGPMTVSDSTITGNTASAGGGGIYNFSAPLTVSDSTITGNTAGTDGGGIANLRGDGGDVTVSDTTISENTATRDGGGIYNDLLGHEGTLAIERSTLSGNTAGSNGGGIYSSTHEYLRRGLVENSTIANSTISGNTATGGYGGGLYNYLGVTQIGHSTITDNTAPSGKGGGVASLGDPEVASTEVSSSIVSGNEDTDVNFIEHPDWGADFDFVNSFVSGGHNLVGDGNATFAFGKSGDRTGVAGPKLGPLQDNGGPTETHVLLTGSPAIDAVPGGTNGCGTDFTADQRGVHRPLGGACDAGSVENYGFGGFFSPVDNPDVLNRAKAGSSIPVKFSLGGDMGLGIFATGTDANNNTFNYPTSSAMRCDSTDRLDAIEETVTAGGGGLSYDPSLDRYTYVWKTSKAWAGTCRQLVVKLDDGTYHRANFKFVR
jgi:CSLREA domain-containing protein